MNFHNSNTHLETSSQATTELGVRVCASLSRVAREGVDVHRDLAIKALGRIGDRAAVPALIEALRDPDEDVRTDAAEALSALADPRAAGPLMESLLGDPCDDVKLNAIAALARLRDPKLTPWLIRLLKGRDEELVWDETEFHETGWDDWTDIQIKAIEALGELGAIEAVQDIAAAIDDEFGQDLTDAGFKALAKLGTPGVETLVRYLADGDERQRRRVAAILAGLSGSLAEEATSRALRDPARNVRVAAARVLAARDPEDARLLALFRDSSPAIRAFALENIGPRLPEWIERLLGDRSHLAQRAILDLLAAKPGLLPRDTVLDWVRLKLRGPSVELAAAAAEPLATIAPDVALDDLVAQVRESGKPVEVRAAAIRSLRGIGRDETARALTEFVGDDRREIRLEAMLTLAALARAHVEWPNVSGQALLAALRGELVEPPEPEEETEGADSGPEDEAELVEAPMAEFPKTTMEAITSGGAPDQGVASIPPAELDLSDEDVALLEITSRGPRKQRVSLAPEIAPHQDVRRFAARILGDLAAEDVATALAACLEDDDREVRLAAADSLARIGDRLTAYPEKVIDALRQTAVGEDRDLRLLAVRALATAAGEEGAQLFLDRLGDEDGFVRAAAIRALSSRNATSAEVAAHLEDDEPGVRLAAAEAVAGMDRAFALDRLVEFAFTREGSHRREAARLLRNVDPEAASDWFLAVLDDEDRRRGWQVAIETLEELNRADVEIAGTPAIRASQV